MNESIREGIKSFGLYLKENNGSTAIFASSKKTNEMVSFVKKFGRDNIINEIVEIAEEKQQAILDKAAEEDNLINNDTIVTIEFNANYGWFVIGLGYSKKLNSVKDQLNKYNKKNQEYRLLLKYKVDMNLYKLTYTEVLSVIEQMKQIKEQKDLAIKLRKEQEELSLQNKFDEAKRTNQAVVIKSYTDDCNDPNEDCDTDTITVYAMPNGQYKTTRSHRF